jgi:hypothetical protein
MRPFRSLMLALVLPLCAPSLAHAHKLLVGHQLLAGGKVRIESRFETGGVPLDTEVQVLRPGEEVLWEGTLDEKGMAVFRVRAAEALHVIVSDGTGHKAEGRISAKELAAHMGREAASQAGACLLAPPSPLTSLTATAAVLAPESKASEDSGPLADGSQGPPVGRVLLGVALLLGLAAGFYALQRFRTRTDTVQQL